MKQHQVAAGKKFFRLLERNSEALMQAYLGDTLDESLLSTKQTEDLIKAGAIWRPAADQELHLSSPLRLLLESALSDLRNRQIDANIGSRLSSLKTTKEHYVEARHHHDHVAADSYLSDLNGQVFSLIESLQHSTRTLWGRINNEFGYVTTLQAKIRENELAQTQLRELLESLTILSFESLSEMAGDTRELRRLFIMHLAKAVDDCNQELAIVQARLLALLGRFRELQGRARLLKGFLLHSRQHPDFVPQDPSNQTRVSKLFNQAPAILEVASADIFNGDHEAELLSIASHIQIRRQEREFEAEAVTGVSLEEVEAYDISEQQIKLDAEACLVAALDHPQGLSALDFLEQQQFTYSAEMWLYQIWACYHALNDQHKQHFELQELSRDHHTFTGNSLLEDLVLIPQLDLAGA